MILVMKDISVTSNDGFLDASLFFYNIFLLIYFLWFQAGYLLDMPLMLRVISPLMYVCAPLFYFYVRNSLLNTRGWRKGDWIHFIPVGIHYLDLIPYFLEPSVFKLEYVKLMVADPNQIVNLASGWIPMRLHYIFRILLQTGYYLYLLYWINHLKPWLFKDVFKRTPINSLVMVMLFMGWVVAFQFSFLVMEGLSVFQFSSPEGFDSILRKLSLLGIFFLNLFINFKSKPIFISNAKSQKTRYYQPASSIIHQADLANEKLDIPLDGDEISPIKKRIINLLEVDKVYLKLGMDLTQFSKLLGIQKNQVSHVINSEFGKRFNELLNQYRINHAIQLIKQGYLDNYTLAAMAEQSGFNSRITFFNAFKKEMGTSPSEYWKGFQENKP